VLQLGSLWTVATLPRHVRSSAAGEDFRSQVPLGRTLAIARLWAGAVAVGAVIAGALLPSVFGSDFADAAPPMMVLLCGAVCLAGYFAVLPTFVAQGRARFLARVAVVAVALNIGLDIALVPLVGVAGPAIATTCQNLFVTVALLWVALGRSSAMWIIAAGLPAALAIGLLATDPDSLLLMGVTVAVGLGSLAWGLSEMRGSGALAPTPGSEPQAVSDPDRRQTLVRERSPR